MPGKRVGNHGANQESRHRRVPVRKVEVVSVVPLAFATVLSAPDVGERAHARQGLEVHPLKAGVALGPSIECRIAVDTYAEAALRAVIEERDHIGVHLGQIEQEVPIADPRQTLLLFHI